MATQIHVEPRAPFNLDLNQNQKIMKRNMGRLFKLAALTATIPLGYTCYLKTKESETFVWGFGRSGQLGLGSENNISFPQLIKHINFVDIAAKKSMSAGITIDGKLYTWGKNRNGLLGHHPPNLNVLLPREVDLDEKVVHVSCGYHHLCAVTQSGNAYVWGINPPKNDFRQIGTTEIRRKALQVKPYKVDLKNIKQVSCSGDYLSFVNNEGKVFLMGVSRVTGINNSSAKGPTEIIELNIDHISRVESGLNFSIALNDEGKVFVWGSNTFGQLGIGSLKSVTIPEQLEFREKIEDISCGDNFSGVVTKDGSVYTWGFGNQGQLGHGDKSDQFLPRKVTNLKGEKIKKISCGGAHTALLTQSGKLFMMGRGRQGQLGREQKDEGNSGNSLLVKQVEQLPKDKSISKVICGANHTVILMDLLK